MPRRQPSNGIMNIFMAKTAFNYNSIICCLVELSLTLMQIIVEVLREKSKCHRHSQATAMIQDFPHGAAHSSRIGT